MLEMEYAGFNSIKARNTRENAHLNDLHLYCAGLWPLSVNRQECNEAVTFPRMESDITRGT